ncbi:CAP domain-containing protein [Geomonas sp.]|uniref:CAP domain-containing protein n=1 Tax=Geomonas sp. TaxID=2651584 RepID=UPI002B45A27F|nr:CAP domain-containing protein [Geomonas sp.]
MFLLLATGSSGASSDRFARDLLTETNLARTNPQRYAGFLRSLRRNFSGKLYRIPGSANMVVTNEGVAAVDDAIAFLEEQRPIAPLKWSQGLAEAAADLVREQSQTGGIGHYGDSGDMEKRIDRHGSWNRRIAENIGYGPDTPRLMVMELIIDDKVPDRGHRKNIFNRSLSVAGAACGPHPRYRNMCVMDFAGGFSEK